MVSKSPSVFLIPTVRSESHVKPPFSLESNPQYQTQIRLPQETAPRPLPVPSLVLHPVSKHTLSPSCMPAPHLAGGSAVNGIVSDTQAGPRGTEHRCKERGAHGALWVRNLPSHHWLLFYTELRSSEWYPKHPGTNFPKPFLCV